MLREKDDEDGPKTFKLFMKLSVYILCPHLQSAHRWLPGSDSDWEDCALTINPFYVHSMGCMNCNGLIQFNIEHISSPFKYLPFRPQWVTAAMQAAVYPHWEQFGVHVLPKHFIRWTFGAGIRTANPLVISPQPANRGLLPTEPPLPPIYFHLPVQEK